MITDARRAGLTWPEMVVLCLIITVAGMIVSSAAIRAVQMPEPEPPATVPSAAADPATHGVTDAVAPAIKTPAAVANRPTTKPVVKPAAKPTARPSPAKKPKADPGLQAAIRTGLPDMVRMLVRGGVNVNQPDEDGLTPLGLAARLGKLQCVKVLLAAGADVNGGAEAGHAPILEATENKFPYVAAMLLDAGADRTVRNANGLSLLHIAAEKGSKPLVQLYIRRGFRVNTQVPSTYKYYKWRTPLDFAMGSGNLDVVELLVNNGAKKGQAPE